MNWDIREVSPGNREWPNSSANEGWNQVSRIRRYERARTSIILNPWTQPIFDNLEVILHTPRDQVKDKQVLSKYKNFQYLMDSGVLQIEALTYIRGRSLPQRYFIVDEAQNLRPLDVKTIITRCREGTKMVFTGDLDQIDTPYLDPMSNGLSLSHQPFHSGRELLLSATEGGGTLPIGRTRGSVIMNTPKILGTRARCRPGRHQHPGFQPSAIFGQQRTVIGGFF